MVETCEELGLPKKEAAARLMEKFSLQEDAAKMHICKYWCESDNGEL